jgi:hypothetical protein
VFPNVPIYCTQQNPRGVASPLYRDTLRKSRIIGEIAAAEGHAVVPVTQAFLNNPTYSTDWIDNTDGLWLHPNGAGHSQAWLPTLKKALGANPPAPPSIGAAKVDQIGFLPRLLESGAPSLGLVNSVAEGWSFDPATQGGVVGTLLGVPPWELVNIVLHWTVATGSGFTGANNGVRWEVGYIPLSDATGSRSSGSLATFTTALLTAGASNSGAYANHADAVFSRVALPGRPLAIRVRRIAADAADTLAEAAFLLGVTVERAA